ncbi:Na+/H+ antiporter NhaA [Entomomonas asaccharolytica]|uniref:Na(+)/H(+) antiporter NhaA n=1 Tax=Entomomonas asaccharolytica TaxID=2785331 RepID=A0A974RXG9_9GAMM|nr:Na+/H+ antiporter NhaA [Entomomonas asaccharolytica]QQP86165.1 Na+/H+ antiporter NhaA [Entomomonas asaccharolytica]
MKQLLISFFRLEAASGILLIIATVLALVANNSLLSDWYNNFLNIPVMLAIDKLIIDKPLLLWINDGLMAIFFLLIGLEVKREALQGQLSKVSQVVLPTVAAFGGMIVPAVIYWAFNHNDPQAHSGWAIPMATDIAFSLGILALLGKAVPISLKLFLMTLAIIDDLGAILVIALFYSGDVSVAALGLAGICLIVLITLNLLKVRSIGLYLIIGFILWVCVLKSGVHATIAGVALAFTIPLKLRMTKAEHIHPPLIKLEHALSPWVSYVILPLFAFVNAGVSFAQVTQDHLLSTVTLGIVLGLLLGKTIGIFGFTWVVVKLGFAKLPKDSDWSLLFGICILCGIGFTMSLFIGGLSFPPNNEYVGIDRVGILIGSFLSAVIGYCVMYRALKKKAKAS